MIDVIGFLWRAKLWVIIGILLGVTGAVITVYAKKPPAYVTSFPITLEVTRSLSTEGIITKFNDFIERTDTRAALSGVEPVGGKMPFKLNAVGNVLTLEVSRLSSDPSGEDAMKTADLLTNIARELNNKIIAAANGVEPNVTTSAPGQDLGEQFAKVAAMAASEEAPLRAKLFALESRLAQKSGIKPQPSMTVNTAVSAGTSLGDDVLRLVGSLDGKLSPAERTAVMHEYSDLVGQIRATQAKYVQPLTEMTTAMATLSPGIIKRATGDIGQVPVLVVDNLAYKASVAAGTHERYESKRALFIVLGFILGGMLGLMAYGVRLFIAENRERIRKIF